MKAMPSWNQFSEDVQRERAKVRSFGLDKVMDLAREPDSTKGQALRQLAMRLEYECLTENLRLQVSNLQESQRRLQVELNNASRAKEADDPAMLKTTVTQSEIENLIRALAHLAGRFEETRDALSYETPEWWQAHDRAICLHRVAESMMPGGAFWRSQDLPRVELRVRGDCP
jgi:hypothetical protein